MPELLLELFSEEIPARMQLRGAEDLARLVGEALAPLSPQNVRRFSGPRRIALAAEVAAGVAARRQSERGPRVGAPEQALAGFLRKHAATRDDLREEGAFWVLDRAVPGVDAATLIADALRGVLRRFPWPKSMRWGGTSAFTWLRPLRRIVCILDGEVVRFDLRQGEDDGHGLASDDQTEGHRFMAPGAFAVRSVAQWQEELRGRYVIVDAAERRAAIERGVAAAAAERGLSVVPDAGLLDEVAGLVEWPVPLLGRIDAAFMDLPPEVVQVSMRVNQRSFAVRDAQGAAAAWFAFVANVEADDGGAAIVAGNERVLRARFSDARHFWDLDRKTKLADRVPALDAVTFHAKLGSQGDRVRRLVRIAGEVAAVTSAYWSRYPDNSPALPNDSQVERAARLCKADLMTGLVGEFPTLQGVAGAYYARHDGEDRVVADAIRDQYSPRNAEDSVPSELTAVSVGLADRLDQLVCFFKIGEKPTGSGDPFALRRAALAVIRLLDENELNLSLGVLLAIADAGVQQNDLVAFIKERLRVKWRGEGQRHDILEAAFVGQEDRIDDLQRCVAALSALLGEPVGRDLLASYRRAASIHRIESQRDGIAYNDQIDESALRDDAEIALTDKVRRVFEEIVQSVAERQYERAIGTLAGLRDPLDRFFARLPVAQDHPTRELMPVTIRPQLPSCHSLITEGCVYKVESNLH